MRNFYRLMRSTRAATAVEYGLILALIFLAAVVAVGGVANSNNNMWNEVSTAADKNMSPRRLSLFGAAMGPIPPRDIKIFKTYSPYSSDFDPHTTGNRVSEIRSTVM